MSINDQPPVLLPQTFYRDDIRPELEINDSSQDNNCSSESSSSSSSSGDRSPPLLPPILVPYAESPESPESNNFSSDPINWSIEDVVR